MIEPARFGEAWWLLYKYISTLSEYINVDIYIYISHGDYCIMWYYVIYQHSTIHRDFFSIFWCDLIMKHCLFNPSDDPKRAGLVGPEGYPNDLFSRASDFCYRNSSDPGPTFLGIIFVWVQLFNEDPKTHALSQKIYGYGSIPINTIFNGMNIHLPAILMFTRGTRFWHTAILLVWFPNVSN